MSCGLDPDQGRHSVRVQAVRKDYQQTTKSPLARKELLEDILVDQWFMRCHLKTFLIKNSGSPFVRWSETICAILGEDIMRNISVRLL